MAKKFPQKKSIFNTIPSITQLLKRIVEEEYERNRRVHRSMNQKAFNDPTNPYTGLLSLFSLWLTPIKSFKWKINVIYSSKKIALFIVHNDNFCNFVNCEDCGFL